ncbi:EAL domain-containing protein [Acidothermaceae bacterium B102]|nr:EAL domain-containing protein [Acidothermaceae bacterium B102]
MADRRLAVVVTVAALLVAFSVLLEAAPFSAYGERAFDDAVQGLAAFAGAFACLFRARRTTGRLRTSWALFAAATCSWGIGQVVWSYYEVVVREAAPFPSLADAGYLLFPVCALAALLVRPSAAFDGRGRPRVVLDGLMVAGALFNLSWATTLGTVYKDGADSVGSLIVGMAYPVEDLVVLAVAVMVLIHARSRTGLLLVTAGIVGMSVADSAFVYLTAKGDYATGNPVDIAWVAAFLLIGLAALLDAGQAVGQTESRASSPLYLGLPYVLVVIGISVVVADSLRGRADPVTVVVGAVELAALLTRQYLLVLDNRQLAAHSQQQQDELRHRAFHDPLTGLANRALFADRIGHALELHHRTIRPLAVLFCDLDDFKAVNDTLGHDAGDALLVAVANRLTATVRTGDSVARLGGDEFGVLIEDDGDALALADRILAALAAPIVLVDRRLRVHASIGVARVSRTDDPIDGVELLKRADLAMYAAKGSGKFTVAEYTSALRDGHADNLDMQLALAADVTSGGVRAALQPILLADGTVYGYEALARWDYDGKPVQPLTFVSMADRAGVLPDLDLGVIAQGIANIDSLPAGDEPAVLTVNIGLTHLPHPGLVPILLRLLAEHGVAPHRLVVEIPEDRSIEDPAVLRTLRALREAGVLLALDDFGVGYSSLSRMGHLRADLVKLDQSFVVDLESSAEARDMFSAVVDLAHRIGARVIAEGIETEGQYTIARALGSDAVQGYLLGRPTELVPQVLRTV